MTTHTHHENILWIVAVNDNRRVAEAVSPLLRTVALTLVARSDGSKLCVPRCSMVVAGLHHNVIMTVTHTNIRTRATQINSCIELTVAILTQCRNTIAEA